MALVVTIAACRGSGTSATSASAPPTAASPATTSTAASTTTSTGQPTTTQATTTTAPPATTTSSTTVVATTTTVPGPPVYPLLGILADDPGLLNRPALAVKINDAASARPQHGINQADIVFEEIVEGITRFLAVFQSSDSAQVGSVRSARTSDLDLLGALSHPLFAWSGGNNYVTDAVAAAPLTDIGRQTHPEVYSAGRKLRDYTEFFINTLEAQRYAPPGQGAPAPVFAYRAPDEPLSPAAQPVAGIALQMAATGVEWRWNSDAAGWDRFQSGTRHIDSEGVQVSPPNVVVLFTNYVQSPADPRSPEAVTVGEGTLWFLTGGQIVGGTWRRDSPTSSYQLFDDAGRVIRLTPGRTWVELATEDGARKIEDGA